MNQRNGLLLLVIALGLFLINACSKQETDTDLPYILLDGPNPYFIDSIGGQYVEPGYHGLDDIDGELTSSIIVNYPVITADSAKSYYVVYSLTDKSGNKFSTYRTVVVRNTAWFLEGFYSKCTRSCDVDTTVSPTFAASVLMSPISNDSFLIQNYGDYGPTVQIVMALNHLTGKISAIVPQNINDSVTLDMVDTVNSYVIQRDTIRFQVYYSLTKNGQPENCGMIFRN